MEGNKKGFLTPDQIDALLEQPYRVVDLLPVQVPADSPGQYFAVEDYYLKPAQLAVLHRKFAGILLKLNCYFEIEAGGVSGDAWIRETGGDTRNPEPGKESGGDTRDPEAGRAPGEMLWARNPDPEELAGTLCSAEGIWTLYVYFPAEDSLIFINCDDTYMTVYHPTERLLDLTRQLAAAEGLFVRQPEQQ